MPSARRRSSRPRRLKLKVTEKELQIAGMQQQIEELKKQRRAGVAAAPGRGAGTGTRGDCCADASRTTGSNLCQKANSAATCCIGCVSPLGQACGTILWESKRTKNWSDGWLAKLRDDQRAAKAELALIVTQALPKGVERFDQIDGVWVTEPRCAVPVAMALRQTLIEIAAARHASEGQQTKMELVYQYLTGPRFRHRVEAIVEKFSDMQADLDRERKVMTQQWAKREEQIQRRDRLDRRHVRRPAGDRRQRHQGDRRP